MLKRRSPREVIESLPRYDVERSLIKYPGREPVETTDVETATENETSEDVKKLRAAKADNKLKPYMHIHTHPTKIKNYTIRDLFRINFGIPDNEVDNIDKINAMPSGGDLRGFILSGNQKSMAVAVRDSETGKFLGYQVIRKTKKARDWGTSDKHFKQHPIRTILTRLNASIFNFGRAYNELNADMGILDIYMGGALSGDYASFKDYFDKICDKYHLQHKLVSAKGYKPSKFGTCFVKKNGLEGKVAVVSLLLAIILMSSNITGDVIGMSQNASNWLAGLFFLIALAGAWFYFRRK